MKQDHHLTRKEIVEFLEGHLDHRSRDRMLEHLERYRMCVGFLADVVRGEAVSGEGALVDGKARLDQKRGSG